MHANFVASLSACCCALLSCAAGDCRLGFHSRLEVKDLLVAFMRSRHARGCSGHLLLLLFGGIRFLVAGLILRLILRFDWQWHNETRPLIQALCFVGFSTAGSTCRTSAQGGRVLPKRLTRPRLCAFRSQLVSCLRLQSLLSRKESGASSALRKPTPFAVQQ